ncbi:ABC transporter ATP-binding protein/permease [Actinoallomurus sp. NBC_01490]|uniref:ABC transporter ATP-binding protein n=1 Tax=Actinoallomurus sp. NBC_01490 TaxID=2903557 RepID=UPI002E355960|nr:ABC transporter ATP-binding protein [Actinoallomurus sp. NBC_01490]
MRKSRGSPEISAARLAWRALCQLHVRQRVFLAMAAVAMLASAFLTAIVPVVLGQLVNKVVAQPHVIHRALLTGLITVAAVLLITQLLQVIRRQLVESVSTAFERDTRELAYEHVLHQDLSYVQQGKIGGIYGRINRGIEGSTRLLKLSFMDFLPTGALALAAVAISFSRNVSVALVMACVIPTGLLLVRWQIHSQAGIRVAVRNHKEEIDGQVVELLPALETVRAYNAQDYFSARVAVSAGELRGAEMRHHRAMAWFDAAKYANEALWYVLVLSFAIGLVTVGRLGPGEVLAYALLFNNIIAPLRDLHRMLDEAAESGQQARDLANLLDRPKDVSFSVSNRRAVVREAAREAVPVGAGVKGPNAGAFCDEVVQVRDVMFSYPGGDGSRVLDGVSLSVRSGERVGLAGPSGCGKSTLLKIIDRLQHGYVGDIELFGVPLSSYSRAELARRVGYVSQRYFLYRGTIYDNIVFGLEDEVIPSQVEDAARRANVHDVIKNLSDGYQTLVHERGDSLSGGQAQRICLARALLRRPDLLLLDEPTSALDNESQRAVQRAIEELEGITIIEVAHRLDTLRSADRICVLEDGRLAEQGTYDELASSDGVFARLLRSSHDEDLRG